MFSNLIYFLAVLYAISAVYFAGIMVRLMLTLTPIVCILSGIAFSIFFELYSKDVQDPKKKEDTSAKITQYDKVNF